uniref:Uncharacterized protein n=1 Tax=viral metagenome TaxID=1070528 RepID=A0A6C0CXF5_9ZZZZ
MDDNSLLVIILAFILGCMCSGMMKQMCGNKTYGSQMVPHRRYNTCNKLIEGASNGQHNFEIDKRDSGCFPANILFDDDVSLIELKRDVNNYSSDDYFIRGYGLEKPTISRVTELIFDDNYIMFKFNRSADSEPPVYVTNTLTRNEYQVKADDWNGYKISVIYVHYPKYGMILVYPKSDEYNIGKEKFPVMMLDDTLMNFVEKKI